MNFAARSCQPPVGSIPLFDTRGFSIKGYFKYSCARAIRGWPFSRKSSILAVMTWHTREGCVTIIRHSLAALFLRLTLKPVAKFFYRSTAFRYFLSFLSLPMALFPILPVFFLLAVPLFLSHLMLVLLIAEVYASFPSLFAEADPREPAKIYLLAALPVMIVVGGDIITRLEIVLLRAITFFFFNPRLAILFAFAAAISGRSGIEAVRNHEEIHHELLDTLSDYSNLRARTIDAYHRTQIAVIVCLAYDQITCALLLPIRLTKRLLGLPGSY